MVSISHIRSTEKFLEQLWKHGQSPMGTWGGRGAELLQLSGRVEPFQLRHVLNGLSPDGRPALVPDARSIERLPGLEITFNAPKSVSVLWALASDNTARRIQGNHQAAVEYALHHVERAVNWEGGSLAAKTGSRNVPLLAAFHGQASDGYDPHLHSRVVLTNFDGRLEAIKDSTITRMQHHLDWVYGWQLRDQLKLEHGLTAAPAHDGFKLVGVPNDICHHFSRGLERVRHPQHELFAAWRREAADVGWGNHEAKALLDFRKAQRVFAEQLSLKTEEWSAHQGRSLHPNLANTLSNNQPVGAQQQQQQSQSKDQDHGHSH